MKHISSYLVSGVFILLLFCGFAMNMLLPKPELLVGERRRPATFPRFSLDDTLSGRWMEGFGRYATDNMVFRESLRTIKAAAVFYLFAQTDKSGLYMDSAVGLGRFEQTDTTGVELGAAKIRSMADLFAGMRDVDVYLAIIPDKSYYAKRFYPGFDIEVIHNSLIEPMQASGGIPHINAIDLTEALAASDFYSTDIHWDQHKLAMQWMQDGVLRHTGVLGVLADVMGCADRMEDTFDINTLTTFQGVYPGQLAMTSRRDEMRYATSPAIDGASVRYYENGWIQGPMYDFAEAYGRDPYGMFLSGVQALVVIENPSASTDRRLIMFRDSFGSALAPLLTSAYSSITLVDLRYIDSRMLVEYVDMSGGSCDVLFLYSSQILNNAHVLLVNN